MRGFVSFAQPARYGYYGYCWVLGYDFFFRQSWPTHIVMSRFLIRLLSVLLLASIVAASVLVAYAWHGMALSEQRATLDFAIDKGASLRAASRHMQEAGLPVQPEMFVLLARLMGQANRIKAGSYQVHAGITPLELLDKLTRGDVTQGAIQFVEGINFHHMRMLLDAHPDLRHDSQALSEADILARIGAAETHAEGLFFPDTYLFDKHSSDLDVLRRAYQAQQGHVAELWQQRGARLPLKSAYEALILASIVEKETGQAADRPLIAAVFINRLRRGMLLQTDPTVIYGLGTDFDGNLRKRDLTADTPHNTYTRRGLPPTPIAMPGLDSLKAALHPAQADYLYFVARGDGSSEFSHNLEQHNRAVQRYQRGQARGN